MNTLLSWTNRGRVTDRRMDGWTDNIAVARTEFACIVSRGK